MEYVILGVFGSVIFKVMRRSDGSTLCKPLIFVPDRGKAEMTGSDTEAVFLLEEFVDRHSGRQGGSLQGPGAAADDEIGDGSHLCFDDEFIQ